MESAPTTTNQTEETLPIDLDAYWSVLQLVVVMVFSIGIALATVL